MVHRYFEDYISVLNEFLDRGENRENLDRVVDLLKESGKERKIYLIGNGGSAAVAEHIAVDLTKNAGLEAMAFSGTPMLTAYANDCGYEKIFSEPIRKFCSKGDLLFAVSSGGSSENIINACSVANDKGMIVVTFSGFKRANPLSQIGEINFWVDSFAYGYVELIHNLLLHYINDAVIGSAVYSSAGSNALEFSHA